MNNAPIPPEQCVYFSYTNHRGEHNTRSVKPIGIFYGTSQWHHEPQWLLRAWDTEKDAERTFAMNDVSDWRAA